MDAKSAQRTIPGWLPPNTTLTKPEIESLLQQYQQFGSGRIENQNSGPPINPVSTFPTAKNESYAPMFFEPPKLTSTKQSVAEHMPPKSTPKSSIQNAINFTFASLLEPLGNKTTESNPPKSDILANPSQHLNILARGTSQDFNLFDIGAQASQVTKIFTEVPSNIIGVANNPEESQKRIRELSNRIQNWRQTKELHAQVLAVENQATGGGVRNDLEKQDTRQLASQLGGEVHVFRDLTGKERGDQSAYFSWGLRAIKREKEKENNRNQDKTLLPPSVPSRGKFDAAGAQHQEHTGSSAGTGRRSGGF